jgi:hypothetical protein
MIICIFFLKFFFLEFAIGLFYAYLKLQLFSNFFKCTILVRNPVSIPECRWALHKDWPLLPFQLLLEIQVKWKEADLWPML